VAQASRQKGISVADKESCGTPEGDGFLSSSQYALPEMETREAVLDAKVGPSATLCSTCSAGLKAHGEAALSALHTHLIAA